MTWKRMFLALAIYWLLLGESYTEKESNGIVIKTEYHGAVWIILYKIYTDEEKPFFKITRTKI